MKRRLGRVAIVAFLCASAVAQPPGGGDFDARYLAPLRAASCPDPAKTAAPEIIPFNASAVPLQILNPARRNLGALTFVGGFDLASADTRFGGLSGLDLLDDRTLLAVSDEGRFIWIDLGADGVTPIAARVVALHDASGDFLSGKGEGDAEGLAVNDGLALVSFERDHRILAYDIAACGAAARGAPIVSGAFGEAADAVFKRDNLAVESNGGMEGLAVTPDWMVFAGLESPLGAASHLSARAAEGPMEFDLDIGAKQPSVVGLDTLPLANGDVRVFSLHRSTNPLASVVVSIVETVFTRDLDQANLPARITSEIAERSHARFRPVSSRVLAEMNLLVTTDNFEGIAARALPDGRVRLFIVSDNNFSGRQRTLLMAYDLAAPG